MEDLCRANQMACKDKDMEGVDPERYLFILTRTSIICFDVWKSECVPHANGNELPTASVPHFINLSKEGEGRGLPMGMAPLTLSSGAKYLIGGEILGQDLSRGVRSKLCQDAYKVIPKISHHPNGRDLSSFHLVKDEASIPKMETGKGNPVVEEIGGKIYVLHARTSYYPELPPPPVYFEVFDQVNKVWNTLRDPPCTTEYRRSLNEDAYGRRPVPVTKGWISRHILLGNRLFIYGLCPSEEYFDADEGKWFQKGRGTPPFDVLMATPCVGSPEPFDYYRAPDPHYYVAVAFRPDPCAFLVDRHGFLLARQLLPEMFSNVLPISTSSALHSALIRLPGSCNGRFRMCVVLHGSERVGLCRKLLAVSIFCLRALPGFDKFKDFYDDKCNPKREPYSDLEDLEFVEMEVEKKFSCVVNVPGSDFMTNAFFL